MGSQQQLVPQLSSSPSPRGSSRAGEHVASSSSPSKPPSLFDIAEQAPATDASDSSVTAVDVKDVKDDETTTTGVTEEATGQRYGFREPSRSTTPVVRGQTDSPALPDPNGLGWPAKSTLSRLNSTPEERKEREEKLADAVRTLLECIGEDPERDGLRRTPERYANALMWLTRGYEERLAGASASF